MLNLVDNVIKNVLDTDWPAGGPTKPDMYFSIPNEDWKMRVTGTQVRLNIYLYETRENRDFRRSSWDNVESPGAGTVQPSMPPAYLDCHYLISSWSPMIDSDTGTTISDEHKVLAEALRVLMRNPDVNPATLGITDGGDVFQQAHIYLTVAPPEAPRVLNDFWGTMKLPWRPAIQLIATAPLDLLRDAAAGPALLTIVQRYVRTDATSAPDELFLIGGWVLHSTDDSPISQATVSRVSGAQVLEDVKTDNQGRFVFTGLRGNVHTFYATAPGLTGPPPRTLDIATAAINDHIFRMS